MNPDFIDLLDAFAEAGVEFVVVGAHALAVHGVARATGDLDVFVRPDPLNASRVVAGLLAFGAPLRAHGVTAADLARRGTVYQLGLPPHRIDVLTHIDGVTFDEAWAERVTRDTDGRPVAYLGRTTLIANKRAAARPKDLADVAMLEALDAYRG